MSEEVPTNKWRHCSETLRQMNLPGNGDRPIAKLGETLTGVSINKPLIRKKKAEQSRGSGTGGEYQWHTHICMQALLSGEGLGLAGASPMALAPPSIPDLPWRRVCPLFDCATQRTPPLLLLSAAPSSSTSSLLFSLKPAYLHGALSVPLCSVTSP